ncbi:MAG: hypothetical protein A2736_00635 [Candidatus Yanofskybacteria bacterium RIFCSPHIGHO2_01_FULL_41_27]|uniref:50S ribosomal protein L35 n=2 Tax=Candidatus Yanofskyibacteriota TaxID=1752733 RepID=A0A0G0ZSP5_9BACT|nr:MAG: hypothetical protein UU84_C0049G0008 [Candidatus Yanofskybacteria bacterium GW2011_GWC2_41_9]OGM99561.1 MAG: hypothetical protein A2736_00635 [Candidatus Yanofskybacteria bacterium RIFCSPHIGHO2_01_FULL_41_27]OGN09493.1 MAG: hypothetical protein A3C64_01320 [Candidatus Yanofskybacteria bacterium RIFCSPHIGHO2_02_FULL_41_12]OGN20892.1 MAG: hypothetical protein A3B00_00785 [Candidatus Yanofskybacteria bacterium RIFCSPLOWO2_01_FULL_41_33]
MTWIRGNKTNKSLAKRVKITGRKKIMKRPPGQNHFNAKEPGQSSRFKKGFLAVPKSIEKDIRTLLPNT